MTILKSVRIDKDVFLELQRTAKQEQRSLSNLINKILSDFANKK